MEYNKQQFIKANDHKVLHKVKKQWVVLSLSMLALLGGGAFAEHFSVRADSINNGQDQSSLKDRLNQSLSQFNKPSTLVQSPAKVQFARNNTYNGRQLNNNGQIHSTSQNITNQANVLHNRILRNADKQEFNDADQNDHQGNQSSKNPVAQVGTPFVHGLLGKYFGPYDLTDNIMYFNPMNGGNQIGQEGRYLKLVGRHHHYVWAHINGFPGIATNQRISINNYPDFPKGYRFINDAYISQLQINGDSPLSYYRKNSVTDNLNGVTFYPSSNQVVFPDNRDGLNFNEDLFPILLTNGNVRVKVVRHHIDGRPDDSHWVNLPSSDLLVSDTSNKNIRYNMSDAVPQSNIGSKVKDTHIDDPMPKGNGYYSDSYTYTLPNNWQSLDKDGFDYQDYLKGYSADDNNSNKLNGTFQLGNSSDEGAQAKLSNGVLTLNYNQEPDYVKIPVHYKDVDVNASSTDKNYVNSHVSYVKFNKIYNSEGSSYSLVPSVNKTNLQIEGLSGFPSNYETYPQSQNEFTIDSNGQTVIPVAKQRVVAEGNWDLSDTNSAKFEVTSDDNGNHPHSDTLTFYGGPLDTNSWNKAGYYTDPQNKTGAVYVFGPTENGSDEAPNALNRDSISKVKFAKETTLPTGSDGYTGLFKDMHYLTSVDFGYQGNNVNMDTSKPTTLASMFSDDTSLQSLDLTGLDVSSVTDMSNMFAGDSALNSLTLSTTPTNKLKDMSGMFASDYKLTGTKFSTPKNPYVHDNSDGSTTSDIHNLNDIKTSDVSDMSDVFESDKGLINLDLSSWHTDNVSDMDAMFANDPNLQHLNIQNMTTKGMYVGASDQMFQGDFSDSNTNYSDNPNANPKPKDYAIVMNNQMRLTNGSGLIGYWASPDYKTDPVMFSPRELDQYGANLGYKPSATWIKQANNPNDLTAETFQYYNQMNSLVGSAKTSIPKDYRVNVSPYEFIEHDTPSGYQLPANGGSLRDSLLNSNVSNSLFNSFSDVDQRVNVLGKMESSAMPLRVTENGESNFSNATKHVEISGYYGDFKDSYDGENKWYKNASGGNGPDSYYSLSTSSNDSGHKMYYTLSSGSYSPGPSSTNIQWQNNNLISTNNQNAQEPFLGYSNMAAKVDIHFIDQDNNQVSSDKVPNITARNYDGDNNYRSNLVNNYINSVHIGQSIPLPHRHDGFANPTSDAYHNYGLPAGYQVVTGQPDHYIVARPSETNGTDQVYVHVSGKEETATAKVNLVYEDSDGNNVSDIQSDPVQLSGNVSDTVNFNPLTITPKTGYQLDTDKTNSFNNVDGSFPARLDKYNSSNWVDPRNPLNNNYHYPNVKMQDRSQITNGEPTVFFKDVQAVLTTVYINQSGNVVGSPDTIEGTAGNSVNVTDPKENGEAIPQGYILDGGDNKPAGQNSDVIGNNQDTQYTLNAGHHTVYLHVNGESDNDAHVRVLCVLHNRDHSTSVQSDNDYDLKNNTDNGKVHIGDVINVNPSNLINKDTHDPILKKLENYLNDNHYGIAPSDQSQPVTVVGKNQVSPQTVIFNYDQNSNARDESITYHFYDQDTNREVSSGIDKGTIGKPDNPANTHLPQGYSLVNNASNYNYTFSNVPQDVWIPVKGQSKNNTFTIYQIENHLDGSRTVNPISIPVSYEIGQSFHVSPYGFNYQDGASTKSYSVPSGYHADPSDQDMDVQVKSNGQLSRSSVAYSYSQDYQPSAIGAVEIHYITGTPNRSHQEIDHVSDHGLVGDNFILRPYYDDLPDTIADGYQSTGQVYGDSGSLSPSSLNGKLDVNYYFNNGVTQFQSGSTPNIYIQVEKING